MVDFNRKNKEFSYQVSLATSATEIFDFKEDRETDDYLPFRNIQILNTGLADIKVYFDRGVGAGYKLVPAGTILDRENLNINFLRIVNTSATQTAEFTLSLDNDFKQIELLKALVLK